MLRDALASGTGPAPASAPFGGASAAGAGAANTGVVAVAGCDDGVGTVGAAGVAGAGGASTTGGVSGATAAGAAGGDGTPATGGDSTRGALAWAGIADSEAGGVLFGFGGGGSRRTGAGGAGATAVVAVGTAGESRSVNSSMKTLSRGMVASTIITAVVTSTTWIASDAVSGTSRAVARVEVSKARTRPFIPAHNRRFNARNHG
jgi:hypothetical protein